jgi:thioredoxin-like negative regulator of GroEL
MQNLTTETFAELVGNQPHAVVKFWAPWCGNCKDNDPFVEAVAATSDIPFYAVNIDEEPKLKLQARLKVIPALVFYRNGRMNQFIIGLTTEEMIQKKLKMLTFA